MGKNTRSKSESQCYFVQLQIDTYLDGELGSLQREEFQSHVKACQTCAREFQYAQTVYDFVLDLPQLDCDDQVLEPIDRLGRGADAATTGKQSFWRGVLNWIDSVPLFARYAFPVLLLVAITVPFVNQLQNPQSEPALLAGQATTQTTPQYTPEEIQQALLDLNLAIKYLNGVGQRTEAMIGGRFLITPLQDSLDASFEVMRRRNDDPLQNDPI